MLSPWRRKRKKQDKRGGIGGVGGWGTGGSGTDPSGSIKRQSIVHPANLKGGAAERGVQKGQTFSEVSNQVGGS